MKQYTLSSENEVTSPEQIQVAGANTPFPLIAWSDKANKVLKVNVLGTSKTNSLSIENTSGEDIIAIKIHAPQRINSSPHFLAHYRTASKGWAEVYHTDVKTSAVSKAYDLPLVQENDGFSTSSRDANVYFTRLTDSEVSIVSSASHGILGRWTRNKSSSHASLHVASEVVVRGTTSVAVRIAHVSTAGDWELIRNGDAVWSRAEMLAGVVAADWAELGTSESLVHELGVESEQGVLGAYVHRVRRHLSDLQSLLSWLQAMPQTMMSSFLSPSGDEQQRFFRGKAVVVATDSGWVAALDASRAGQLLWRKKAVDLQHGKKWNVIGLTVVGEVATIHHEDGSTTVFDAASGKLASRNPPSVPIKTFAGVQDSPSVVTVKVLADGTPAPASGIITDWIYLVTLSGDGRALGWHLGTTHTRIWEFRPPPGFRLVDASARPANDPVASIGKVLGNRSVLYKYLSPNLALLTAVSNTALAMYLLDAVSGQVLYTTTHTGVDPSLPTSSAITENWFVYSFFGDAGPTSSTKSHQLVVSELYDSEYPNYRGELGESSNYSTFAGGSSLPIPHVVSQAFIIPEPISHMAVTQTSQGITSRQLLCALPNSDAIVGLPRYLLDPRRPIGRDPTAIEAEEGLMKYTPMLDFDPKFYLTHSRDVMGIKKMITSTTMLESTSLVFVYGLDIFGTRIAPSQAFDILGKGFNKLSLIATVAALGVGVAVLAPMVSSTLLYLLLLDFTNASIQVRKRQIDSRWKMS